MDPHPHGLKMCDQATRLGGFPAAVHPFKQDEGAPPASLRGAIAGCPAHVFTASGVGAPAVETARSTYDTVQLASITQHARMGDLVHTQKDFWRGADPLIPRQVTQT